MDAKPLELLLTPPEAAHALKISPRKLWSLSESGDIPRIKLGRAVRYSPADLATFIDRQRAMSLASAG